MTWTPVPAGGLAWSDSPSSTASAGFVFDVSNVAALAVLSDALAAGAVGGVLRLQFTFDEWSPTAANTNWVPT